MKAFKYLVFFIFTTISFSLHSATVWYNTSYPNNTHSTPEAACKWYLSEVGLSPFHSILQDGRMYFCYYGSTSKSGGFGIYQKEIDDPVPEPEKCEVNTLPLDVRVPSNSGSVVCIQGCQHTIYKCVDVLFDAGDFEPGMSCLATNDGRECGTPRPSNPNPTPPVTQDPTNPTDKPEEQRIFENIMSVIGNKLDGIKDAITGGNQNQNGGETGGSTGGNTGGDVTVNVDMSETNAKIDETNSLIDELTKWLQGEDLGDDIFGDQEPPEKELTPQQLDTNIFSGRAQCPADARLSFNLLGGKSFTTTFEFKDWCDNLEIFGSLILIASYLFGAYIIVSKS